MSEGFDFTKFMAGISAKNADPATRELLREAVGDEMNNAMGEVGPRMWCMLQEQMEKDPANTIHLNAVLNSAIFSLVTWIAACTPKGETAGRDNDESLREKIMINLEQALAHRSDENSREVALLGRNVGKLKLMQDSHATLAHILVQNSMVIKGCHEVVDKLRRE